MIEIVEEITINNIDFLVFDCKKEVQTSLFDFLETEKKTFKIINKN